MTEWEEFFFKTGNTNLYKLWPDCGAGGTRMIVEWSPESIGIFLGMYVCLNVCMYCHIHWMCLCNSAMLFRTYSILLLSILKVSSVFSLHVKGFFSISWEFFLIRCKILGQGCRMCTDCKALWGKFVICDIMLYKINWIEKMSRYPDLGQVTG